MKVGRNEKCPCGSNLKYKNCCLIIEKNPFQSSNQEVPQVNDVEIFHGFTADYEDQGPFEIDFDKACCLVIKANAVIAAEQNRNINFDLVKAGDWFVLAEVNGQTKASYRYDTADDAMDVAKEKFNAARFLCFPEFI
jgi:hypothetical protein